MWRSFPYLQKLQREVSVPITPLLQWACCCSSSLPLPSPLSTIKPIILLECVEEGWRRSRKAKSEAASVPHWYVHSRYEHICLIPLLYCFYHSLLIAGWKEWIRIAAFILCWSFYPPSVHLQLPLSTLLTFMFEWTSSHKNHFLLEM